MKKEKAEPDNVELGPVYLQSKRDYRIDKPTPAAMTGVFATSYSA
jgi:hypothetical protein